MVFINVYGSYPIFAMSSKSFLTFFFLASLVTLGHSLILNMAFCQFL